MEQYNKLSKFVNIKIDSSIRFHLNLLKSRNDIKNISLLIYNLILLSEIEYTLIKDNKEIEVGGLFLPGRLREGWKVKFIDWRNLMPKP